MMKNVFYFPLKALLVFKVINKIIAIYILPNISRIKDNPTMKFGRLIEYNMRNIFLETSYTKYREETTPRPFSKKSKLSISRDIYSKVLYSLFLLYAKLSSKS